MAPRIFATTIDIARPPSRVWAVMSDIARWPEWTGSITSVQRTSPGALGVGSTARVKQPKLATADFTVTKWEPDHGFDWVTSNPLVTATGRHAIEPSSSRGARVTLSVEFTGPLAAVIAWAYGGLTRRYVRMEAEGLKAQSERVPE